LIGRQFARDDGLTEALGGAVKSEISDLAESENEFERQFWDELIETYAPVWAEDGSEVIAVSEFYQRPDELRAEIRGAQLRSWLAVGIATLLMYGLLAGMVGRASNTIEAQQADLEEKVAELSRLLAQNEQLNERVRRAAARTAALNEQFLLRISADLHDGPGQDLALALLRIESLVESCSRCPVQVSAGRTVADDFRTVQTSLKSALTEVRAISAGLRLPDLDSLTAADAARRAVRDYERKTHHQVALTLGDLPENVPLSVKITLYRIVQEALANGYRHANGAQQMVRLAQVDDELYLEVTDSGDGFDPKRVPGNGHLGLAGMRERVEILGGRFVVDSGPKQGTKIRTYLPINVPGVADG
jgi:signal transduction histidine kinase